jgi:hypothetical protein
MDDLTYYILRTAVRVARDEQIRTLKALRARLATLFPDAPDQRDAAIKTWAEYTVSAHPNGVTRWER